MNNNKNNYVKLVKNRTYKRLFFILLTNNANYFIKFLPSFNHLIWATNNV